MGHKDCGDIEITTASTEDSQFRPVFYWSDENQNNGFDVSFNTATISERQATKLVGLLLDLYPGIDDAIWNRDRRPDEHG